MADVSVEFGAQDVGLEKALQQIQSEMGNLQGKVKSGELSMTELEQTMKRIGQVETMEKRLKAMGDQSGAASPKVNALGQDIAGAGDKSEKMGEQAGISFGKLAAAVGVGQLAAKAFTAALDAGFAAVRGTIQGFTDALDLGGTLSDLSASTGETAGNLLLLQRAFDNTGSGADAVGPVLAKLQNNIFGAGEGSKTAADAFGRMGISMDEMAGKTPTEQLALVASGISGIQDPAARAATAIDIFGKSGAQLLPLLTNFSGEMNEASATVGSMADIMNRRANVFDAVGDRFLIISQKVRDFAAGILDKALPAIDAITSALSRIDAAAIGQRLADAFLGGQQAMKGFQAAVDAISIGQVGLAFQVFWESLKLQAMQTADSIYKNLAAAFQTAGDFIQTIFSPSGATMAYVEGAFNLLGMKAAAAIAESFASALPDNALFGSLKKSMQDFAATTKEESNLLWGAMYHDVGSLKTQLESAGAALPKSFEENYGKIPPLFDGITDQQGKVAALEAEVAAAAAKTTEERTAQAAQTDAELAKRQALKDAQAQADAESKAEKAELITLETKINEAKAAGNTELAKSLEQELQSKKAKEEIAKLTEEYVKTLGVDADEAGRLATNFVNAKNAAAGVAVDKTTIAAAKAESAEAAKAAQSFATWLDYIKGVDPTAPVKSLKEQAADARKEINAFGEYIGTDLTNKSYPDIAKKLGIDTMGMTGTEQLDAILEHIANKRGELTGIKPIDEAGSAASVEAIQKKIQDTLGTTPQTLNLDASKSIEDIKTKLAESIDLALSSSKGSEILSEIKGFVETIKGLVEKIEPKLPVAALV